MNDGEKIFVEHSKEEVNNAIDQAISVKRNYITIRHLNRDIYFNYIKDKYEKTQYLSIEAPKYEPTQAEKDKGVLIARGLIRKSGFNREKRFIERRNKILEDLRKQEAILGIQTTVDKIEQYNKLKLKQCKKN